MPDDFDSRVADRFKVLDDAPVPDTWSRVQLKVLDHIPVQTTEEDTTMIDLETLSGSDRQKRPKWVLVAGLLAAAAVLVAIALVLIRDASDATPADQPSPTVTPTVTVPARAMPPNSPRGGPLEPGTYFVDEVDGTPTPRIFVTIDAGWRFVTDHGMLILNHDIGTIAFNRPVRVFSDACHQNEGFHPGPVDTVEGLVAALREQHGGWTDVTAPTDITLDGYAGQAFQRTAPTDFPDCETGFGKTRLSASAVTIPTFMSWEGGLGFLYEPGETETLWVLDIDGTVVLINTAVWAGPSSAARADVAAAVLASIRIERSSSTETVASESAVSTPAILPVGGREVGVGPLAPDLGQFTDQATLIEALVASGPLDNQSLSDPNLRPGVSICADLVRYHEPSKGTLVHVANATLNGQRGVVVVYMASSGSKNVRMYETVDLDPDTGLCPLLMNAPLN